MQAPLVSVAWAKASGGALTRRQRSQLWPAIVRGLWAALRAHLPLSRAQAERLSEPEVPDSLLVQRAQQAAREVPSAIVEHGYRTWSFGWALAALDRVALDPELFYVGSLLHDAGLAQAVAGEDFTLRGAALVQRACDEAGTPSELRDALADSIVAHFTPGLRYEHDPIGYYIQAGALLDLGGARMRDLPESFLRGVYARHPQRDLRALIVRSLADEARAVPCGRTALLQAAGLSLGVRVSATRSY